MSVILKSLNVRGGSSGGGSAAVGPSGSIQFAVSGSVSGTAGMTFDGAHTLSVGDTGGTILNLGGTYSPNTPSTPVASIILPANTGGTYGSGLLILDQTESSEHNNWGVTIGTSAIVGTGQRPCTLSFNSHLDGSFDGIQYNNSVSGTNLPAIFIQGQNGVCITGHNGGISYLCVTPDGNTMLAQYPGGASPNLDANNGILQLKASVNSTSGIAFGNDSIQTTIYRYDQSVLAIGPCNTLMGSLSGTTATDGWPYLPSTAGTPTGTPNNVVAGYTPIQIDTTNGKLWAYYGGAWHYTVFI